ncbi:MAG: PAS domain S-box protein [Steroidobacteraceae bacterium]
MKLPIVRTMQCGFGALVVILFVVGALTYRGIIASTTTARWAQHTNEVLEHLADLRSAAENIEGGYRDFALSGDSRFLQASRTSVSLAEQELTTLRALTVDNPAQQRRLGVVTDLTKRMVQRGDPILRLSHTGGTEIAASDVRDLTSDSTMEEFRAATREMKNEEEELLHERNAEAEREYRRTKTALIGGRSLALLIAVISGWLVPRAYAARARAEAAFISSEERLRILIEGAHEYAIFMLDLRGVVVSWNAGAERIMGYMADEIIGQHFSRFYPQEDLARGKPDEELRIAATTGGSAAERWRVRKDGSGFWSHLVIRATRNSSGALLGFSEISHDITERKETEARYRGLLEAAPDAMVVVNEAGSIVLLNLQAEKQFGYRRDELIGRQVATIIPRGFAERLLADGTRSAAEALAQQIGTGITIQGRRKNGSDFPIEIMLSPLEGPDGILVTAAIRDITARVQSEEREYGLQQQLRESSHQAGKAEIATGVLHNVGNVLNSLGIANSTALRDLRALRVDRLQQTSSLIRDHRGTLAAFLTDDEHGRNLPDYLAALTEHFAGNVQAAHAEMNTIDQLLHHLRDIVTAQQASAKLGGSREPVDLKELAEAALLLQATELAHIEVVRLYEDVPTITTDRHRVLQILLNFLSNARDAIHVTATSPGRIVVRLCRDGDHALFSIEDSGVGMSEELISRLWRFGFTTKQEGHGFGLHNSANAARAMGATIDAQSDGQGKGSRFVLRLPIDSSSQLPLGLAA